MSCRCADETGTTRGAGARARRVTTALAVWPRTLRNCCLTSICRCHPRVRRLDLVIAISYLRNGTVKQSRSHLKFESRLTAFTFCTCVQRGWLPTKAPGSGGGGLLYVSRWPSSTLRDAAPRGRSPCSEFSSTTPPGTCCAACAASACPPTRRACASTASARRCAQQPRPRPRRR